MRKTFFFSWEFVFLCFVSWGNIRVKATLVRDAHFVHCSNRHTCNSNDIQAGGMLIWSHKSSQNTTVLPSRNSREAISLFLSIEKCSGSKTPQQFASCGQLTVLFYSTLNLTALAKFQTRFWLIMAIKLTNLLQSGLSSEIWLGEGHSAI